MNKFLIFCSFFIFGSPHGISQDSKEDFVVLIESLLRDQKFYNKKINCEPIQCKKAFDCPNVEYFDLFGRIKCFRNTEYAGVDKNIKEFNFLAEIASIHPIFKDKTSEKYEAFIKIRGLDAFNNFKDLYSSNILNFENQLSGEVSFMDILNYNNSEKSFDEFIILIEKIDSKDSDILQSPIRCSQCNSKWREYLNRESENLYGEKYLKSIGIYNSFKNARNIKSENRRELSKALSEELGFNIDLDKQETPFEKVINSTYFLVVAPIILFGFILFLVRKRVNKICSSIFSKSSSSATQITNTEPVESISTIDDEIEWTLFLDHLDKHVDKSLQNMSGWLKKNEKAVLRELEFDRNNFVSKDSYNKLKESIKNSPNTGHATDPYDGQGGMSHQSSINHSIKYADPPIGGYFRDLSDKPFMCPFKIEIEGSHARYSIVKNNPDAQISAIQGHMNILQSCCIYKNQPTGTSIQTVTPGKLILESDGWKIKDKAEIRFV